METSALKRFAPQARNLLIDQVAVKLAGVLADDSSARREQPSAVAELERQIAALGEEELVEKVAYTWFNRLTALRYMDANDLNTLQVVTPAEGQSQPEILAEAMAGHVDTSIVSEEIAERVRGLLSGAATSADPQDEAYRLLVVAACNAWHTTMPYMFERIADYTELLMPTGLLARDSVLSRLREVMTDEACEDVEVIGWLYQFYILEKKDEVFAGLKKNKKITAENIPAATQLFTPHWIVRYLVENSLGRLWLLNRPQSRLADRMDYYIAPVEPETDFLRISGPEDLRICDPAVGSGHMLTYAFDLLFAIYEEEGYDANEIPAIILTNNLTGVEIDDRAGALAAFALAMKAAKILGRRRFVRMAAKPNICVLEDIRFTDSEMDDVETVVGEDLFTDELRETLGQFVHAKNFGSLIIPKLTDPAEALRIVNARDFEDDLLLREVQERVVTLLRMAEALSSKFHVVIANPPYMGSKGMNEMLQAFAKVSYPASKADLFAMFMERCLALALPQGAMAMINMQSWMFLSSFEKLRKSLLAKANILTMAHIGTRGFDSISGEVVATTAFVLCNSQPAVRQGTFLRLISGRNEAEKSELALQCVREPTCQFRYRKASTEFERIPGSPLAYWFSDAALQGFKRGVQLNQFLTLRKGLTTMNNGRFLKYWHEVESSQFCADAPDAQTALESKRTWFPVNKGGGDRKWFGLNEFVINWKNSGREIKQYISEKYDGGSYTKEIRSEEYYFQENITWSTLSASFLSMRYSPAGFIFESKGSVGLSESSNDLRAALCYANSKVINVFLGALSPTLDYNAGPVGRCPILVTKETEARDRARELIEISKADWDSFETSWDFVSVPLLSAEHRAETLEDSYEALRCHWQSMTDEMLRLEAENNRTFIEAYGLQNEITPKVPLDEITLTCNPAYRYGTRNSPEANEDRLRADTMAEFLSYAVGCMFGRYSLDKPGLILANQGETLEDYLTRVPDPTFMPDKNNVIPVLSGDWFPDDVTERFRLFLRTTFGEEHFGANLRFIEDALGKDIRKYFLRDFYNEHVKRYKKRPIYWMFSSPKGTFNALIYMHRYRPDTVGVVLNDYVREYVKKLEAHREQQQRVQVDPGAPASAKTKALKEIEEATKIAIELEAYQKEVLYPLATKRIEIDLDDGVKANYPKFGAALKPIAGL